jgi:hypothetical protein
LAGQGYLKEATRLLRFRRLFLLATIILFLLTGAAWGQSRTPTSPGPNQPLPSDREDVKTSPEGQRDLPLKDLREQPAQAKEDQAGKSLKKPYPVKPKPKDSTGKKSGAGKPTSASRQDPFAQETRSEWWPRREQPSPPELSPLELSLQQDREQDATPDEAEEKREEFENLPQGAKKLFKSAKRPEDSELEEEQAEKSENLPQELMKSPKSPLDSDLEGDYRRSQW